MIKHDPNERSLPYSRTGFEKSTPLVQNLQKQVDTLVLSPDQIKNLEQISDEWRWVLYIEDWARHSQCEV
jgi:hypothetical protein